MNALETADKAEAQRIRKLERDRIRMREKRRHDSEEIANLQVLSMAQDICVHNLNAIIEEQVRRNGRMRQKMNRAKWNARFAYFMVAVLASTLVAMRF